MIALAIGWLLTGCEGRLVEQLRRDRSVAACSRYLARYPDGAHAAEARRVRDRARFSLARAADRPIGYTMYLRREPEGSFRSRARQRLAELLLARAHSVAAVEIVVERYGRTSAAKRADKRLAALLAKEALHSKAPALSRRYLARYPTHAKAVAVREHLAQLLYAELSNRLSDLERFSRRFSGTRAGARASERVRRWLIAELEAIPRRDILEEIEVRYPEDSELIRLRELVREAELGRALSVVSIERLKRLARDPSRHASATSRPGVGSDAKRGAAARRAAEAVAWCERREARCARLRLVARRAARWTPARSASQLRALAYAADMQQAWDAIERLGWLAEPRAGDVLYQLVGSQRLAAVWPASHALRRWLALQPRSTARRWVERRLAEEASSGDRDERQRQAFLRMIRARAIAARAAAPRRRETAAPRTSVGRASAGESSSRRQGRRAMQSLLASPGRQLAASYLVLAAGGKGVAAALVRGARARLEYLKGAFPDELHDDSLPAAKLAERELFAIRRALDAARRGPIGGRSAQKLRELADDVDRQLARWRLKLSRARSGYESAHEVDLARTVQRHEQGRTAALRRLVRKRGWLARAVARALCRTQRPPLGSSAGGAGRRGPRVGESGPATVEWRRRCKPLGRHVERRTEVR